MMRVSLADKWVRAKAVLRVLGAVLLVDRVSNRALGKVRDRTLTSEPMENQVARADLRAEKAAQDSKIPVVRSVRPMEAMRSSMHRGRGRSARP